VYLCAIPCSVHSAFCAHLLQFTYFNSNLQRLRGKSAFWEMCIFEQYFIGSGWSGQVGKACGLRAMFFSNSGFTKAVCFVAGVWRFRLWGQFCGWLEGWRCERAENTGDAFLSG
jgi:hypothetical protein